MVYRDFRDLLRRDACYKVLCDKTFNFAKNPKYYGCQRGLALIIYNAFDKKSAAAAACSNKSTTYAGAGINSSSEKYQF